MAAGAAAVDGVDPDGVRPLPLSDGGNGLLDALRFAGGGEVRRVTVTGPLNRPVRARFLVQPRRVVVETAEACGLHLVPVGLRDPLRTTTWGVGELLRAATLALPEDAELVVGLGGSATVDAGAGLAYALGWRLLDEDGEPILP
ncbi:MAG TPA: glycerate kinase, partial [Longimicrobiales bacterium]|nr:glycerate kinase [Longimicrobiales bacterium]